MLERVSTHDSNDVNAPSLEFIGPGTDVGTHDIKIVKVKNLYDIRCKVYSASSSNDFGGGSLYCKRSSRRHGRAYHKKPIYSKRGRNRGCTRSRKN
jgi:hypothetical protein